MKQSMRKTKQAGVYLLSDGRYYLRATYTEQGGRQCQRWKVSEGRTPLEAAAERERWIRELQSGMIERVQLGKNTVASYAELWMRRKVQRNEIAKSTASRYSSALEIWILPAIGHLDVRAVTKGDMERFMDTMVETKLQHRTSNSIWRVAKNMLNSAVDDFSLPANPAGRVRALPEKPTQKKVMSRDELATLFDFTRRHYPRWYEPFLLMATTGIRTGEWCALQWGDIQPEGPSVLIQRAAMSVGGIKEPKNGYARHEPLLPWVYDALMELRRRQVEEQNPGLRDGWVFPSPVWGDKTGWRWGPNALRDNLTSICLRAGIRRFTPHELRHTCATRLLETGADRSVIEGMLGHMPQSRATGMYLHPSFELRQKAQQLAFEPIGEEHGK